MTALNSFLSFANWLKNRPELAGVNQTVDANELPAPPYVFLELCSETFPAKWISETNVILRLVVEKVAGDRLETTAGRLRGKLLNLLEDPGMLDKKNYDTDEKPSVGCFSVYVSSISSNQSRVSDVDERIITLVLTSNVKIK